MESYMWIVWLVIFVIMVIIEASGPALVSIWFAAGALISLILSLIPNIPWWVEIIAFVVVSVAALFALRPFSKKLLKRNTIASNVDSLIGKKGFVVEEISYLKPGSCKINDVVWTAVNVKEDESIAKDEVIEVVSINGNKLFVKKVEEK